MKKKTQIEMSYLQMEYFYLLKGIDAFMGGCKIQKSSVINM